MAAIHFLVFVALTVLSLSLLLPVARANSEGDALYALRRSLSDPDKVLQSWDPNLVKPLHLVSRHLQPRQPRYPCVCILSVFADLSVAGFDFACDSQTYHGYHLARDLGNSNLSGHLVPELGNLNICSISRLYWHCSILNQTSLTCRELYKNRFKGQFQLSLVT
ncbi:UNVERIFIED_CONTAM: Leucine-rich repeat protein 2 [Sesamum radiatum]|uniref:Leucine-rich repeat protein 2 n=1 Tax=Sesamum radiatum TaxID=300843 RepID=A0AAW2NRS3_SESRA